MRVLIAAPHDAYNPYCRELGDGYAQAGCEVAHGLDDFWSGHLPADLVHLHWPEHLLLDWMRPATDGEAVFAVLDRWRARATVIATVHNATPHRPTPGWEAYAAGVYGRCDGIVHHGERSREWFAGAFPALAGIPSTVLPHGAYASFPDEISRAEARLLLGVGAEDRVVLVFGRWRHLAELALAARGVRRARVPRLCLLINDLLPARRLGWVRNRLALARHLTGIRHVVYPGLLRPERVQVPLRAADLLLVQRLDGLNSGNVPLAFTFGLPVVSPDLGVFGEEARRHGNPVYTPGDAPSLSRALEAAFALDLVELGRRNRTVAGGEWRSPVIAARLLEFASNLREKRGGR